MLAQVRQQHLINLVAMVRAALASGNLGSDAELPSLVAALFSTLQVRRCPPARQRVGMLQVSTAPLPRGKPVIWKACN